MTQRNTDGPDANSRSQPRRSGFRRLNSDPGRNKPGLVLVLLNPNRPRDRSHYELFPFWHQTFYRHVEATSCTPFASRALDRGLPGVVVSMARHLNHALTPPSGAMAADALQAVQDTIAQALSQRCIDAGAADEELGEHQPQLVAEQARTKGLTLAVSRDPALPSAFAADPVRLAQLLINLLNNAVKYTPDGGHIALEVRQQDAQIVLQVSDNGCGLDDEAPVRHVTRLQAERGNGDEEVPRPRAVHDGVGLVGRLLFHD